MGTFYSLGIVQNFTAKSTGTTSIIAGLMSIGTSMAVNGKIIHWSTG
jgi:hypothetical protein